MKATRLVAASLMSFLPMSSVKSEEILVNLKSATLTFTATDHAFKTAGSSLKFQRTYNSRQSAKGIFGSKWCSHFETKLLFNESSLELDHCNGNRRTFAFEGGAEFKPEYLAVLIISAVRKRRPNLSEDYIQRLHRELETNAFLREEFISRLGLRVPLQRYVKYKEPSSDAIIIFDGRTFELTDHDGFSSLFDQDGHQLRSIDPWGFSVRQFYESGRLVSLVDDFGNAFKLAYRSDGSLSEISSSDGAVVKYDFSGGDLVTVRVNGATEQYEYDAFHHVSRVMKNDRTALQASYNTDKDWVIKVEDSSGCSESYSYLTQSEGTFISLALRTCQGRIVQQTAAIFSSPDGSNHVASVDFIRNGELGKLSRDSRTETSAALRLNGQQTYFLRDEQGRLSERQSTDGTISFSYEPRCRDPYEIRRSNLDERGNISTEIVHLKLAQGDCSQLSGITSSSGWQASISFDRFVRLTELAELGGATLRFLYPKETGSAEVSSIELVGEGRMSIGRDNGNESGERHSGTELPEHILLHIRRLKGHLAWLWSENRSAGARNLLEFLNSRERELDKSTPTPDQNNWLTFNGAKVEDSFDHDLCSCILAGGYLPRPPMLVEDTKVGNENEKLESFLSICKSAVSSTGTILSARICDALEWEKLANDVASGDLKGARSELASSNLAVLAKQSPPGSVSQLLVALERLLTVLSSISDTDFVGKMASEIAGIVSALHGAELQRAVVLAHAQLQSFQAHQSLMQIDRASSEIEAALVTIRNSSGLTREESDDDLNARWLRIATDVLLSDKLPVRPDWMETALAWLDMAANKKAIDQKSALLILDKLQLAAESEAWARARLAKAIGDSYESTLSISAGVVGKDVATNQSGSRDLLRISLALARISREARPDLMGARQSVVSLGHLEVGRLLQEGDAEAARAITKEVFSDAAALAKAGALNGYTDPIQNLVNKWADWYNKQNKPFGRVALQLEYLAESEQWNLAVDHARAWDEIGLVIAEQAQLLNLSPGRSSVVTECDSLAGFSRDPELPADGVPFDKIDTKSAASVCRKEITSYPNLPRLRFELGRTLQAAGEFRAAEDEFRLAAHQDYAFGFRALGLLIQYNELLAPPGEHERLLKAFGERMVLRYGRQLATSWRSNAEQEARTASQWLLERAAALGDSQAKADFGTQSPSERALEAEPRFY
jgi:YD repeat-containing protein